MTGCAVGLVEALNTRVYGNGSQTLILAHGYGSDQSVWHYLVPCLAYFFKVVVFDWAFTANVDPQLYDTNKYSSYDGYAQDLVCILDQLKVTNTIYLGHSMAAMIGCLAAVKRPLLFQHLIHLNGSPRYLNTTSYEGGFSRTEVDTIFNNIRENFPEWVRNFAPQAIMVNDINAIAELEYTLGRMNPDIALAVAENVFLSDYRTVLPQVQVPSTIIQSERDIIVPKSVAFYMKRHLGGQAKVIILKTEGHFPQLTAYHLLLRVLKRVLHIR